MTLIQLHLTLMQSQLIDSVSAEIRDEMKRQSVSQRELARRVGWAQSQLWKRLRGLVPYRTDEIERIARALDVPVSQLMSPRTLAS